MNAATRRLLHYEDGRFSKIAVVFALAGPARVRLAWMADFILSKLEVNVLYECPTDFSLSLSCVGVQRTADLRFCRTVSMKVVRRRGFHVEGKRTNSFCFYRNNVVLVLQCA
jgi:hypothetical protein